MLDAKLDAKQQKNNGSSDKRTYYYFSPFDQFVEDGDGNVESRLPMDEDDLTDEALDGMIQEAKSKKGSDAFKAHKRDLAFARALDRIQAGVL